jgi:hypothetical protein
MKTLFSMIVLSLAVGLLIAIAVSAIVPSH